MEFCEPSTCPVRAEKFWRFCGIAALLGLVLLLVIAGLTGRLPSERAVARAFERKHSAWHVESVKQGEGDTDGCEYIIAYRTSPSDPLQHGIWYVYSSGSLGWDVQSEELSPPANRLPHQ